ncbi:unnamed protein product [Amoebophrya sp. A120]|nr:unnamed protein product [Amoebophrya sp. A120]|eukprot:GSA120T00023568001.1
MKNGPTLLEENFTSPGAATSVMLDGNFTSNKSGGINGMKMMNNHSNNFLLSNVEQQLSGISASLKALGVEMELASDEEDDSSAASAGVEQDVRMNQQQAGMHHVQAVAASNCTTRGKNKGKQVIAPGPQQDPQEDEQDFLHSLHETKQLLQKQLKLLQNSLAQVAGTAAAPAKIKEKTRQHQRNKKNHQKLSTFDHDQENLSSSSSSEDAYSVECEQRNKSNEANNPDLLLDQYGESPPKRIKSPGRHRWVVENKKDEMKKNKNYSRAGWIKQNKNLHSATSEDQDSSSNSHQSGHHQKNATLSRSAIDLAETLISSPSAALVSSLPKTPLSSWNYFEKVADTVKAVVAEKVFQLVIDKYADDREGDVGGVFQKSLCRLYSANPYDICNTNVLLRPALLVKRMTRHGYFESALRRIIPSYQRRLEEGKKIYVTAVNDVRRDLDEMFFHLKSQRSLVLEIIITEPCREEIAC